MPYYRKKTRTYGYRKKKRIPKKYYSKTKKMVTGQSPTLLENIASGVGGLASVAKAVLPAIASINTELKYYDETNAYSVYGTFANSDLRCITDGITTGTTDSSRIGNSILAKNIQIRFALSMPMTTTSATPVLGCHARIMIFTWKYNDSGGPSVTKLLEAPTNIYSPVNKDFSDQFVVMKDKHFVFNASVVPGTAATATQGYQHFKYYKDLNWHMRWTDSSQAIANHVWILTMATSSGPTNAVGVTFYSRLNYTDN